MLAESSFNAAFWSKIPFTPLHRLSVYLALVSVRELAERVTLNNIQFHFGKCLIFCHMQVFDRQHSPRSEFDILIQLLCNNFSKLFSMTHSAYPHMETARKNWVLDQFSLCLFPHPRCLDFVTSCKFLAPEFRWKVGQASNWSEMTVGRVDDQAMAFIWLWSVLEAFYHLWKWFGLKGVGGSEK